MGNGELETQEVEESKDGEIKIPEETPAEIPYVAKRATVASVKKDIDALRKDVEKDVYEWLGQLDIRLENAEVRTIKHNEALLGDVKTRLGIIEQGSLSDRENVANDITKRIEAAESAIGTIVDALRSHIKGTEELPPEAAAAAEYGETPIQPVEERTRTEDIKAQADVCQTMTDVLLICRFLKADPTLTDEERNEILKIATRAADVQVTQGLQIRAGVRNAET